MQCRLIRLIGVPINLLGNWLVVWRKSELIMRTVLCRIVYRGWILHQSQASHMSKWLV